MLAVSDEYTFITVLIKMKKALLTGNIPQIFSYSFFNYGFAYFFGLLLMTLPAMLLQKWAWVIVIPRIVSAISALIAAFFIQKTLGKAPKAITFIALTGLASMPGFWIYGTWFHPDWSMTAALLAAIFAFQKDQWELKKYYWIGSICLGLALGIKFQALTFLPLVFFYLIQAKQHSYWQRFKSGLLGFGITAGIFLACNPYLIHSEGRIAFMRALRINMISNTNNHGIGTIVSLQSKLEGAVGTLFFRPELAIILFCIVLAMACRFWISLKKPPVLMDGVAVITLINLIYLFFAINKNWGHYYIAPMTLGWVIAMHELMRLKPRHPQLLTGVVCIAVVYNLATSVPTLYAHWENKPYTLALQKAAPLTAEITEVLRGKIEPNMTLLTDISTLVDTEALNIPFESLHHIYGPLRKDHFDESAHHKRFLDLGLTHYPPFSPKSWIVIDTSLLDLKQYESRADFHDYKGAIQLIEALQKGDFGYHMIYESERVMIFARDP